MALLQRHLERDRQLAAALHCRGAQSHDFPCQRPSSPTFGDPSSLHGGCGGCAIRSNILDAILLDRHAELTASNVTSTMSMALKSSSARASAVSFAAWLSPSPASRSSELLHRPPSFASVKAFAAPTRPQAIVVSAFRHQNSLFVHPDIHTQSLARVTLLHMQRTGACRLPWLSSWYW